MTDQPHVEKTEESCSLPKKPKQAETGLGMAAELLIGLIVTGFAIFVIIESIRMPHRAQPLSWTPDSCR